MDTFRFTTEFEQHVVWHATLTPKFGPFLEKLDSAFFTCDETRFIGRALAAWGREHRRVPSSFDVLLQVMHREQAAMGVDDELLANSVAWLCELQVTCTPPDPEAVFVEVRKTLIEHAQFVAVADLVRSARSRGGEHTAQHARKIIEATNLGKVERQAPTPVRGLDGLLEAMESGGDLDVMSTCCALDATMPGGGIERASFSLIAGNTNVGKSFLTLQVAAAALIQGHNAIIDVLESTKERVSVRLTAILSGKTMAAVRADKVGAILAVRERWPNLGKVIINQTPAVGSSAREITERWAAEASNLGKPFAVGALDYIDLVEGSEDAEVRVVRDYELMKHVCKFFADFVIQPSAPVERVVSPTQSQRLLDDYKPLTVNSLADSHHKARIVDTIWAINKKRTPPPSGIFNGHIPSEKDLFVEVECVKNRQQQVGRKTGVVMADLDRAVLLPNQTWFAPYGTAVSL